MVNINVLSLIRAGGLITGAKSLDQEECEAMLGICIEDFVESLLIFNLSHLAIH